MIPVRTLADNHYFMFEMFLNEYDITIDEIISRCDVKLVDEASKIYSSIKNIIIEGTYLVTESSLQSMRFNEQQFNDMVYLYEHQIKSYFYAWEGLENDKTPFLEGHTYDKKFGLSFGDHILWGEEGKIKQRPNKLFFYLENGICGRYEIKFHNGKEMSFSIKENGEVVKMDVWLNKNRLSDKSIIPTYVLFKSFYNLNLLPSKNKIAYKLMRNVMTVVCEIIKENQNDLN